MPIAESVLNFVAGPVGDVAGAYLQDHFNRASAKRSMQFQEHMSSSAYQRAAVDLDKAGLNRVLAVGNPASSPAGASLPSSVPALGSSFNTGRVAGAQAANLKSQTDLNLANVGLVQQSTAKAEAETAESLQRALTGASQQRLNDANRVLSELSATKTPYEIQHLLAQVRSLDASAGAAGASQKQLEALSRVTGVSADVLEVLRSATVAIKPVVDYAASKLESLGRATANDDFFGRIGSYMGSEFFRWRYGNSADRGYPGFDRKHLPPRVPFK